jgi:hypothetical protein
MQGHAADKTGCPTIIFNAVFSDHYFRINSFWSINYNWSYITRIRTGYIYYQIRKNYYFISTDLFCRFSPFGDYRVCVKYYYTSCHSLIR